MFIHSEKATKIWNTLSSCFDAGNVEKSRHTTYSRNNIGQKCEGNCGLGVLNEIINGMYPESLKKTVGAVWELPAK